MSSVLVQGVEDFLAQEQEKLKKRVKVFKIEEWMGNVEGVVKGYFANNFRKV